MKKTLKEFAISFSGLKLGKHEFDYKLDASFFSHFGEVEFTQPSVTAKVVLDKQTTLMELTMEVSGTIDVACDISTISFPMPIVNEALVVVKFGDTFDDDNDEVLQLPHGAHQLDVSKYLYELVVLALPFKRVHPDVKNGKLGDEYLQLLKAYSPDKDQDEEQEDATEADPRWNKLKDLLN